LHGLSGQPPLLEVAERPKKWLTRRNVIMMAQNVANKNIVLYMLVG
jgi:hypothetical protein